MAINVSQAFKRTSIAPIDETLALTKAQMVATVDTLMPAYYFTICQDDGKIYLYDKSATPSVTTGKFTEFSGGGGGGSSDVKFFTTTDTLSKTINGTKVVAAADLPGVTWSDLVVGSSVIKDAKGTMGLVTTIAGTTSVTVTTATTSTPTVELTQAQYDALATKDPDTIYFITDAEEGTGGHTIIDTDGNSMPTEIGLQFTGLDVQDNSADSETEVAAFGLNTDSLDDIMSAGAAGNQVAGNGLVYSTTEQIIGKWVDGRPLYQKTIIGEPLSGIVDGTQSQFNYPIGYNSGDLQYLQIAEANIVSNGKTTTLSLNDAYTSGNTVYYIRATLEPINNVENIIIRTNRSAFNTHTPYFTIRYTKTGGA